MPSTYDIGDTIRLTATFTDTGGAGANPTKVNFLYDTPTSTAPTTATRSSGSKGTVDGITLTTETGGYHSDLQSTGKAL